MSSKLWIVVFFFWCLVFGHCIIYVLTEKSTIFTSFSFCIAGFVIMHPCFSQGMYHTYKKLCMLGFKFIMGFKLIVIWKKGNTCKNQTGLKEFNTKMYLNYNMCYNLSIPWGRTKWLRRGVTGSACSGYESSGCCMALTAIY